MVYAINTCSTLNYLPVDVINKSEIINELKHQTFGDLK